MTGRLARCALIGVLVLTSACKTGVQHAQEMEGSDPVAKSQALLYFAEKEKDALEPETRDLIRDTLAGDRNPMVRAQAAYVLGELPPQDEYAEWLLRAVKDESFHVRFDAVVALGKIGNRVPSKRSAIVDALKTTLTKDAHGWVKMKSARALEQLKAAEAAKELIAALEDGDAAVRFNAHRALVSITGQDLPRDHAEWVDWLGESGK